MREFLLGEGDREGIGDNSTFNNESRLDWFPLGRFIDLFLKALSTTTELLLLDDVGGKENVTCVALELFIARLPFLLLASFDGLFRSCNISDNLSLNALFNTVFT